MKVGLGTRKVTPSGISPARGREGILLHATVHISLLRLGVPAGEPVRGAPVVSVFSKVVSSLKSGMTLKFLSCQFRNLE